MARSLVSSVLAVVLLPAFLASQSVQFEATTTATASAEVFLFNQWWRDSSSLPVNTPIIGRGVGASVNLFECGAYATASVGRLADGIRCRANSGGWSICPMNAAASMQLRVVARAATPIRGRLVVSANRPMINSLLVDVFADLDRELTSGIGGGPTGTVEVALEIGPAGMPIDLSYAVGTFGDVTVDIRFFADAAGELSLEERSCGPELRGSLTRDGNDATLRLMAAELPATGTSFMVLGTLPIRVPVPPTNCPLLTDLAVIVPLTRSAAGTNIQRVPLPPDLVGRVYAQVLSGERVGSEERWTTGERLRVDLR